MRHWWLTKFGVLCFNQLVSKHTRGWSGTLSHAFPNVCGSLQAQGSLLGRWSWRLSAPRRSAAGPVELSGSPEVTAAVDQSVSSAMPQEAPSPTPPAASSSCACSSSFSSISSGSSSSPAVGTPPSGAPRIPKEFRSDNSEGWLGVVDGRGLALFFLERDPERGMVQVFPTVVTKCKTYHMLKADEVVERSPWRVQQCWSLVAVVTDHVARQRSS